MANTKRMNRLEEMGRLDSEKAYTPKGKKNLTAEKKRVVKEIEMRSGGRAKMTKSEKASKMGKVKTAAPSRDGVATKGKTKGTLVKMNGSTGMRSGFKRLETKIDALAARR